MATDSEDTKKIQFFDSYLAWEHYTNLEKEFIDYLRYVPLQKEHYNVWSPFLGDLLNNTGSIIDSFLKNVINSGSYHATYQFDDARKSHQNFDMGLYRTFFESFHHFSQKTIYDLIIYEPITPFSSWKDGKSPDWWIRYTKIKHDRFSNKTEATIKTVLDALGALFVLNAVILDTRMILLRDGYIKSNNVNMSKLIGLFQSDEPLKTDQIIYVKTRLFGYVYSIYPKDVAEIAKISILSPWYSGYQG